VLLGFPEEEDVGESVVVEDELEVFGEERSDEEESCCCSFMEHTGDEEIETDAIPVNCAHLMYIYS